MKVIKPSFFIIGAAKAGTTSLAQQLSEHPDIYIPSKKELVFFNYREPNRENVEWYEAAFRTDKSAQISGEASPQYSFGDTFPMCAARLAEYCPQAKIIYLVRDPVIRMQSHILQIRNWGGASQEPVEKIIQRYPQVVGASMYGARIADYRRFFEKDQLLVVQFEKLVGAAPEWLGRISDFLEVDCPSTETLIAKNTSAHHFEDRRVMLYLRAVGLGEVGRWLPHGLKSRCIHWFKRRQTEIPVLSARDADAFGRVFRDDARPLFEEWGLEERGWTFRPQDSRTHLPSEQYEGKVRLA
jgi:hypothetical protein